TGLSRPELRVWAAAGAAARVVNARHAKRARDNNPRLLRPLAGPAVTMEKLQRNHKLQRQTPARAEPAGRNLSLMELKQFWLMSRGGRSLQVASPGRPC